MLKDRHLRQVFVLSAVITPTLPALAQNAAAARQDQDAARVEAIKEQICEVLSEQEFRENQMPSVLQAGYDDGFFIRSSNDKLRGDVNGFMQFRWTHYGTRSGNRCLSMRLERDDHTGIDFERIRMIFSENVWGEGLT